MRITGLKKYKYKYDLHVHTSPTSLCADFTPKETVKKYEMLGFSGFVLTNHFTPDGLEKFPSCREYADYFLDGYYKAKTAGDKAGINVLLGMEIRFPENTNDYLVYGICADDVYSAAEYIESDYKTFYREFKSENNIIVQAHPFRNNVVLCDLDYVDGIEVFNMHPGHNSRIATAAQLVHDNPRLLITGGTDFHHEGHEGLCALCACRKITDSFDVASVILSRDFVFDLKGTKIIPNIL